MAAVYMDYKPVCLSWQASSSSMESYIALKSSMWLIFASPGSCRGKIPRRQVDGAEQVKLSVVQIHAITVQNWCCSTTTSP